MSRFTAETLRFLRGLARNNHRSWFEAHRDEYQHHVRGPMIELIEEMDLRLARIAPEIGGDPKRSMFRIHRDVRFSKDKSPYKTHAACWFHHLRARRQVGREAEGGSAGLYFQIAPGDSFVGGGVWMPARGALNRIRQSIAADPTGLERAVFGGPARRRFGGLSEESMLKRLPRGFPPDHPAGRWLRYQSFTMGRSLSDEEATSARLPSALQRDFSALIPLVRWLNAALGHGPLRGRSALDWIR